MKKRALTASLAVTILLFAKESIAAWEYYTYGGFLPISTAFSKIALIFSDNGFSGLMFTTLITGTMVAIVSTFYRMFRGANMSPLGWLWPFSFGVIVYLALVIPKDNLTIYDPNLNRFQTVQNLPVGVVYTAGILNSIERGMVELVSTSSDPASYQYSSSGFGFKAIREASVGEMRIKDAYFEQTMRRYVKDCVIFELNRPGSNLNWNSLTRDTDNMALQLAEAASPAVFTLNYSPGSPEGTPDSCLNVWNAIVMGLNDVSSYTDWVRNTCAMAGYNPDNISEFTQCKSFYPKYFGMIYGGSSPVSSLEGFLGQVGMANALQKVLTDVNPDVGVKAFAAQNTQTGGIAMGIVAREWLPIMRAVFTAIAIGLIPFLAIMIPFPEAGLKAMMLMVGFFVWLTCWGITDAIVHSFAMDYAIREFESIRSAKLGFTSIMTLPGASEKALGIFGFAQSASIMLATVMTGMLIKFGGHALSMMAGNITGTLQGAAQHGGAVAMRPDVASREYDALLSSVPTMAGAHSFDFGKMAEWKTGESRGAIRAGLETTDRMGAPGFEKAMGDAGAFDKASAAGRGDVFRGVGGEGVRMGSRAQASQPYFEARGDLAKTGMHDVMDVQAAKAFGHSTDTGDGKGLITKHFGPQVKDSQYKMGEYEFYSKAAGGKSSFEYKGAHGHAQGLNGLYTDVSLTSGNGKIGWRDEGAYTHKISEALSREIGFQQVMSNDASVMKRFGLDESKHQALKESISNKLSDSITQSSALKDVKLSGTEHTLAGFIKGSKGIHLPFNLGKAEIGGEYRYTRRNSRGEEVSFTLNEAQNREYTNLLESSTTHGLNETFFSGGGITTALHAAKTSGSKEAQSVADEYSTREHHRAEVDRNLGVLCANELSKKAEYANLSEGERTHKIMSYLNLEAGRNYMETEGHRILQERTGSFRSRSGNTEASVRTGRDNDRVQADGIDEQARVAAAEAAQRTDREVQDRTRAAMENTIRPEADRIRSGHDEKMK